LSDISVFVASRTPVSVFPATLASQCWFEGLPVLHL